MRKHDLDKEYFEWMHHLVCGDRRYSRKPSYRKLFHQLHDTEFTYILPMDGNRAEDGVDLRYRFGRDNSYEDAMIATYLDVRPCSVLEMMVALAVRCEEHIMCNTEIGDRTGQWFWEMIVNLGLASMCDSRYDGEYVGEVVDIFLNREYERDGKGGLFTVEHCDHDLRSVDIWYQMCWYLNDIV